jgi:hypothetical protein
MADQELKACLPSLAPEIGAFLRRPGLIHDLHAAEPYAAASIVMAMLGVRTACLSPFLGLSSMLSCSATCAALQTTAFSESWAFACRPSAHPHMMSARILHMHMHAIHGM